MQPAGTCDPRFDAVREVFIANFDPDRVVTDDGAGASVAVTVDGELVVDLWGGSVTGDAGAVGPWQRDTIVNLWSNTKTVAALALLLLADRGELDLHGPVAAAWPEFAANGKEGVLVRHVLSHTAGLPAWDPALPAGGIYDHALAAEALARQAPWWEPGTASGYHSFTQGHLENELVRRVTGRTLGAFVRDEITGPAGADLHIGTGPEHDDRVAHVVPPRPGPPPEGDSLSARAVRLQSVTGPDANTIAWRRAEIPAANGHGNARSLALVHVPLACGTLLSPATVDAAFEVQADGTDLVLEAPMRHGIGFGLPGPDDPLPHARTLWWGGWGGSMTVIDLTARMTFSYVMSKMADEPEHDDRADRLLAAVYGALPAG
jgi:CubicO group peptidase (beta-lactamase class C family)